jgi:hypothetical protein
LRRLAQVFSLLCVSRAASPMRDRHETASGKPTL